LSQEQAARLLKSTYYEENIMAAGAAPAPETKETKTEAAETSQAQPATLRARIGRKLTEIFQGREEYLGWRQ
jgi:hypothetical protein